MDTANTAFWLNILVQSTTTFAVVAFVGIWFLRLSRGPAGAALADWIRRRRIDTALETELRKEITSLEERIEFLERFVAEPSRGLPESRPFGGHIRSIEPATGRIPTPV